MKKYLAALLAPLKLPERSTVRSDRLISRIPGNKGRCIPIDYDEISPHGCTTGVFVRGISFRGYFLWAIGEEFHGAIQGQSCFVESTTFRGTALTLNERFERIYQLLGKLTSLFNQSPWLFPDFLHDPITPAYQPTSTSNTPTQAPSKESLTDE